MTLYSQRATSRDLSTSDRDKARVELKILANDYRGLENRQKRLNDRTNPQARRIRETLLERDEADADPIEYETQGASTARKREIERGVRAFRRLVPNWGGRKRLKIVTGGTERPHHRIADGGSEIHLSQSSPTSAIVHELGHAHDNRSDKNMSSAVRHYLSRTKGERAKKLRDLTGNAGYDEKEMTRLDELFRAYIGSDYSARIPERVVRRWRLEGETLVRGKGRNEWFYGNEITSVGLEAMYTNPIQLAAQDPKLFDHITDNVMQLPPKRRGRKK